ncbi:MAG: hypothetical protein PHO78_08620 [Methanomicrobium sp.]|nr:hypothetical protein [Methanomicrobium sp.]
MHTNFSPAIISPLTFVIMSFAFGKNLTAPAEYAQRNLSSEKFTPF